jgi:spore coat polysaccharide biosynthesis predicted glycosyltransferase SpsG
VARSAAIAAELRRGAEPVVLIPHACGGDVIRAAGLAPVVTGFETLLDEARHCSAVLLDSYRIAAAEAAAVRAAGAAMAALDDTATAVLPADLVINGAPGAEDLPYDRAAPAEYLLGPRYFPLQERFRGWPARVIRQRVSCVLVTVGGEDVHRLLRPLMEAARNAFADAHVIGVCGQRGANASADENVRYAPSDYVELVRSSDVMICGGGQTLIEAAATGTPAAALVLGDDQRPQLRAVAKAGACIEAGAWNMSADRREEKLRSALSSLRDASHRARLSRNGRALIDDAGAARVAGAIIALAARREAQT